MSTGAASSGDDVTWWENDGTPSNGGWTEHTIDPDLETADIDTSNNSWPKKDNSKFDKFKNYTASFMVALCAN